MRRTTTDGPIRAHVPRSRSAAIVIALTLALVCSSAGLADPLPSASPAAAPATLLCPIKAIVTTVPAHSDEALLTLWSDETAGYATGTIFLYANGKRYAVSFANAVAANSSDVHHLPTPIVIALDTPAPIESAYVSKLDAQACAIHNPYVEDTSAPDHQPVKHSGKRKGPQFSPDWIDNWKTITAQADAMKPLVVSDGVPVDEPHCAKPFVAPSTTYSEPAIIPPQQGRLQVEIPVALEIDERGTPIAVRVLISSRNAAYDRAALVATARSRFAPRIYRCEPVTGDYLFFVEFDS
jgi:TonB family protein